MDAGQGPIKQMEDPESRLNGYPPDALMAGLSYAMGIIQKKQSGGLSDGQNYVVQQLQNMISGGPKPSPQEQSGLPSLANTPSEGEGSLGAMDQGGMNNSNPI